VNPSKTSLCLSLAILAALAGCAAREPAESDSAAVPGREAEKREIARRDSSAGPRRNAPQIAGSTSATAAPQPEAESTVSAPATRVQAPAPTAPPVALAVPERQEAKVVALSAGLAFDQARANEITNTENYDGRPANPVIVTAENPVSTFSIDVDTGSYSNVRRMLAQGQLPPADAVRTEEFINYFDYGYAPPATPATPFSVSTEIAPAPWHDGRHLLLVGIKGYEPAREAIPASNLVFLIDTSGSMADPAKLPLLIESFKQMLPELDARDRVSIVVYAGSAGLVLPPTAGDRHEEIAAALDRLSAGGSTNGAAGIELAYAMAEEAYISGGVNRVILATDGDFNVGTVDLDALKSLIAERRKSGIALTTLGFGQGNYNDALAEQLADIGNGNHFYIDTLAEARKVLGDELTATMLTIASDVKIQIEFNPTVVAEYRLIGYENRLLRREDFNNDRVDAGEIGAGHDVTALYELTLVGSKALQNDPLRYGTKTSAVAVGGEGELGFLKLRYKHPGASRSTLIERPLARSAIAARPSDRLAFVASVAAFAEHLRGGTMLGEFDLDAIKALGAAAKGQDRDGYRAEFLRLVDAARVLATPASEEVATIAR
jgi:Ca-activated chloride channel family protein